MSKFVLEVFALKQYCCGSVFRSNVTLKVLRGIDVVFYFTIKILINGQHQFFNVRFLTLWGQYCFALLLLGNIEYRCNIAPKLKLSEQIYTFTRLKLEIPLLPLIGL